MAGSQSNSGDTDADVQEQLPTIHPNAIQASAQKLYPQERRGENAPEWDPAEFKAEKFDERSEAYQRQQNAHLAAPIDRQAQQPLQQTQPLEPLQPQPQRPSQGEQYRVRQGVRSHPQYQELQQPPYAINAYAGPQPRQTEQAMQPQQWYPQTQTRPPATAYREVTPFLSNLQTE
ncbi:hypothetical protein A1F94_012211 [Pyrenophora tritici-repentis]|nr:hypothetical protein A1F94_012211 [Pyrenophora tritici-repentis]